MYGSVFRPSFAALLHPKLSRMQGRFSTVSQFSSSKGIKDTLADNLSITNLTNRQYFQRVFGEKLISYSFPLLIFAGIVSYVSGTSGAEQQASGVLKMALRKDFLKIENLNDKLDSYSYSFKKAEFGPVAAALSNSDKRNKVAKSLGPERVEAIGSDVVSKFGSTSALATAYAREKRRLEEERKSFMDEMLLLSVDYPNDIIVTDMPEPSYDGVLKKKSDFANETDSGDDRLSSNNNIASRKHTSIKNTKHTPIKSRKEASEPVSSSSVSSPTSSEDVKAELTEGQSLKIQLHRKLALNTQKLLNLDERYFAKISEIIVRVGVKRDNSSPPPMRNKNISPTCVSVAKRNVFVLNFDGDMTASQTEKLKEEITGVIENARSDRGDCVVVKIKSGGGTVHGYGLAAAQLERIKAKGLRVVVCVDEVAASGGYMMASVADKIYASPFAILGSIGVVSMQPNLHERLKREGVKVDEITAGKYKRTLTFFKESNAADRAKVKADVEDILVLFKNHIRKVRPSLDVDKVATGEGINTLLLMLFPPIIVFSRAPSFTLRKVFIHDM